MSPGPSRELTLDAAAIDELVADARMLATDVEEARQRMLALADERAAVIAGLYDAGLSIRQVAARLGVSAGVIQSAVRRGRQILDAMP